MVTDWDWPALFTTSMPFPVIVKVWGTDPTFATVIVCPFFTVSLAGVNTNPPAPCWRESAPAGALELPDAVGAGACVDRVVGVPVGLELLLQAPSTVATDANPITTRIHRALIHLLSPLRIT